MTKAETSPSKASRHFRVSDGRRHKIHCYKVSGYLENETNNWLLLKFPHIIQEKTEKLFLIIGYMGLKNIDYYSS